MTIPEFLQFIGEHFLWDVLHYHWRIVASDYDHPLGFIARRKPDAQVNLKGPSEVVSYLSQHSSSTVTIWLNAASLRS